MTSVREAAIAAHGVGLCVVPPLQDGSKRPFGPWKEYQHVRPQLAEIERWYADGICTGVGLICGSVSGGLELFEFEGRAVEAGVYEQFEALMESEGLSALLERIAAGYTERSPSGGIHHLYRCDDTKCEKLAKNAEGKELIETKGEGGYVIVAPSNGTVHRSGGAWSLERGGFHAIATITPAERQQLHDIARKFELREQPAATPPPRPSMTPRGESWMQGVIDDFNARTTWYDVLAGEFEQVYDRDGIGYWHHVDANNAISATTNATGRDTLIVFSGTAGGAGWGIYEPGMLAPSYDRFSAYVFIDTGRHDTDARVDVAKRLRDEGYGPHRALTPHADSPTGKDGAEANTDPHNSSSSSSSLDQKPAWPTLDPVAYHGLVGEAVRFLEPHTEADPVAVLITLLVELGCMIDSGPHHVVGHVKHGTRLAAVIVGETAKARKGTSKGAADLIANYVDVMFMTDRVLGGFGSGEAVVDEVRDPEPGDDPDRDPGASDKRLLIYEPEFARVLRVCNRDNSLLSMIIRDAWDGRRLETRARTRRAVATDHHVALVGHVTMPELRRNLVATEIAAGFANRILWVCAKRSKLLPFGSDPDPVELARIAGELREHVESARGIDPDGFDNITGPPIEHRPDIPFAADARDRWDQLYREMADDNPGGMLGEIVARPEPQTLRLALTYALLDGAREIRTEHIDAAWALWSYSRASAAHIWGDAVGDEIADTLLQALRRAGDTGMTYTEQSALFSRNVNAKRLTMARMELEQRNLIETVQLPAADSGGKGRVGTVSRILPKHPITKKTKETK